MQSFQPDENWGWCYLDQLFLDFEDRVWLPQSR
jgi:hypothetical protein